MSNQVPPMNQIMNDLMSQDPYNQDWIDWLYKNRYRIVAIAIAASALYGGYYEWVTSKSLFGTYKAKAIYKTYDAMVAASDKASQVKDVVVNTTSNQIKELGTGIIDDVKSVYNDNLKMYLDKILPKSEPQLTQAEEQTLQNLAQKVIDDKALQNIPPEQYLLESAKNKNVPKVNLKILKDQVKLNYPNLDVDNIVAKARWSKGSKLAFFIGLSAIANGAIRGLVGDIAIYDAINNSTNLTNVTVSDILYRGVAFFPNLLSDIGEGAVDWTQFALQKHYNRSLPRLYNKVKDIFQPMKTRYANDPEKLLDKLDEIRENKDSIKVAQLQYGKDDFIEELAKDVGD